MFSVISYIMFDCNGGVLQMELVKEKGEKEMLPGAWLKHEVHARV